MNRTLLRLWIFSLLSFQLIFAPSFAIASRQRKAIVITGATVIDGSGRSGFKANLRITGDTITAVGNFQPTANDEVIDGRGKIVAPGFMDIHNHSESGLLTEPTATSQVSQGITTLAVGPDGGSPYPIADYLAKLE